VHWGGSLIYNREVIKLEETGGSRHTKPMTNRDESAAAGNLDDDSLGGRRLGGPILAGHLFLGGNIIF
jgi:hypothetical protein